jgi:hypothetical protein
MIMLQQLSAIQSIVQQDAAGRWRGGAGASDLMASLTEDFTRACRALAESPEKGIVIVTGFLILGQLAPAPETDGPPGALFLARALAELGKRVVLASDGWCLAALRAGIEAHGGLNGAVSVLALPDPVTGYAWGLERYRRWFFEQVGPVSHLIAIERIGPGYAESSGPQEPAQERPRRNPDSPARCYSAKGRDLTGLHSPAHFLFEFTREGKDIATIGIGDGGNEIGMGRIPRGIISRSIPLGELIACRVPTDSLILCGISNWGGYALAAGCRLLSGRPLTAADYDASREQEVIDSMVQKGRLVDGMTGRPSLSVDGVEFDRYIKALAEIGHVPGILRHE